MDPAVIERYRSMWVAVERDGTIVASSGDLDALLKSLSDRSTNGITIQRIPDPDEPMFVGLR